VGGDDLGLVVQALRAQGFLGIDSAVPDPGLARAQADARPSLARAWLHPSVRLVALPAPAVLQAGPTADAVVAIVRNGWTDGRGRWPDRRALAATRRTLAPGGVQVLAVATTRLPDGALLELLHAFVDVYPAASLWLPPAGADTAILLGPVADAPLPWADVERCVAADPAGLGPLSLHTAVDVAALALADAPALRALAFGAAPGPGLPTSLRDAPSLPLAALPDLPAEPSVFADAPAELAARAPSRAAFLEVIREAARGDVQNAIEQARKLSETPGGARALEPLVTPHLARARQAMERARQEGRASKGWDEAEAALLTARTLFPAYAPTRCLEGELAASQNQLPRAEEAFSACAELDATSLDAYDGLARVRRLRGNLPGAETALRAGLKAHPERWTAAYNLGLFLLELGRNEESERLLRQAAAVQARDTSAPANPAPFLALARLYLSTGKAELALAQAQGAVNLARTADALALRGAARYELRQLDESEQDFRDALVLSPDHVIARGGLGQVQAQRGQYELAAASFKAVLARDPENAAARENLHRLAPLLEAQAP
jgi:tetratricopeptide (TPR) repeat protein